MFESNKFDKILLLLNSTYVYKLSLKYYLIIIKLCANPNGIENNYIGYTIIHINLNDVVFLWSVSNFLIMIIYFCN